MLKGMLTGLLTTATIPEMGTVIEDFAVDDTDGKRIVLSELVEIGPVVVAFYPKAFTSGWTKEMKAYRSRYADLEALNAQIVAISADDKATQKKFKAEIGAPFSFVADPDGELIEKFGIRIPILGMAKRYTFVIGPGRKLLHTHSGGDAIDPQNVIDALSK